MQYPECILFLGQFQNVHIVYMDASSSTNVRFIKDNKCAVCITPEITIKERLDHFTCLNGLALRC
jgi:hypothetical protein